MTLHRTKEAGNQAANGHLSPQTIPSRFNGSTMLALSTSVEQSETGPNQDHIPRNEGGYSTEVVYSFAATPMRG